MNTTGATLQGLQSESEHYRSYGLNYVPKGFGEWYWQDARENIGLLCRLKNPRNARVFQVAL